MKDELLRDNPADLAGLRLDTVQGGARLRNIDDPGVHGLVRLLRATVGAYPGRVLLGEVGIHDAGRWARYHGAEDDELNLAFNFRFWGCSWSAACFRGVVAQAEQLVPSWAWPTYAFSNHDIPRAATRYGEDRMRLAAMLLLTLRGAPFLYYGEEIGMRDVLVPPAQARDPDGRDPCRTPMQWDSLPGGGFTRGRPWLPVAEPTVPDVASQRSDPDSLLSFYRALLRFRAGCRALREGSYHARDGGEGVLAFERRAGDERVLVVLNFGPQPVASAALVPDGAAVMLATRAWHGSARASLAPGEGVVARI